MQKLDIMIRAMWHLALRPLCFVTILIFQSGALSAFADEIIWYSDPAAAAAMAKGTNRFLLVEISAPWCPSCKALEKMMVTKSISDWTNQRFVCIRVSADTPDGLALMRNYGMDGIPSLLVFDSNGRFKGKMQGGPEDPEGYVYYLTKMAGGNSAFARAGNIGTGVGTAGGAPLRPQQEKQIYFSPAQSGSQSLPPGSQSLQQGYETPQPNYLPQQRYYQYGLGYQPQQRYYQYPQQGYSRRKEYRDLLQQGQSANAPGQFPEQGQLFQQQNAPPNQQIQQQ